MQKGWQGLCLAEMAWLEDCNCEILGDLGLILALKKLGGLIMLGVTPFNRFLSNNWAQGKWRQGNALRSWTTKKLLLDKIEKNHGRISSARRWAMTA